METPSWDDLRILLAVHRAGSLLAAGKSLGFSTSTAARRLDALEAALGLQLVQRTRSGTVLNPEAQPLVRLAEEIEHGIDALRRDKQMLAGTLRISVPDGMAHTLAGPLLAFYREHPGVEVELIGENRMADVAGREADIAIRLVRSTSHVLVEKHLASFRFGLYASGDYVQRHLPARRLGQGDAARHAFVGLDPRWKGLAHERWLAAMGATRFPFRSTSMEAIVEAVRQGAGLAALLQNDPRTLGLIPIETPVPGPEQALYLVYHRDLRDAPHVRAAIAAIETHLRAFA